MFRLFVDQLPFLIHRLALDIKHSKQVTNSYQKVTKSYCLFFESYLIKKNNLNLLRVCLQRYYYNLCIIIMIIEKAVLMKIL